MITRKPLNHALTTAFIASGLVLGGTALAQPQGLYSADELMDAEVYSNQKDSSSIGDVEDVLLDESMKLHSLVIDTGNLLDMGQNQYVIEQGQFSVETHNSENREEMQYRVIVNMTEEQITQQPEYDNNWWTETKQTALQAWQNTKQAASSAWQDTKQATSNALNNAGEAVEEAGNETQQAANEAEQETQNAVRNDN